MDCGAVVRTLVQGQEEAYRARLPALRLQLEDAYRSHAVAEAISLIGGRVVIDYYKFQRREDVARLYSDPPPAAALAEIGQLFERNSAHPAIYETAFSWQISPGSQSLERVALLLNVRPGQETNYRQWLASGVAKELEPMWKVNDIYRHDVLLSEGSAIILYECRNKYNALVSSALPVASTIASMKAFRDPDTIRRLMRELVPIFDLDPHMPLVMFEEIQAWSEEE